MDRSGSRSRRLLRDDLRAEPDRDRAHEDAERGSNSCSSIVGSPAIPGLSSFRLPEAPRYAESLPWVSARSTPARDTDVTRDTSRTAILSPELERVIVSTEARVPAVETEASRRSNALLGPFESSVKRGGPVRHTPPHLRN